MSEAIKLIECPRDAWQGLKGQIPAELKTNYLQALISAGFKHIDAVSFVSPNAVPQMADSEAVLKELDPPDDVEIIGIVVNEKGAQRAIATEAVRTLGFPYSISPTFLQNNQRQTLEDAIEELEKIEKKADEASLDTVVYISMAFGNPYGDPWSVDEIGEVRLPRNRSPSAQPSRPGRRQNHRSLQCRLPPLRLRHRRPRRMPLRAG